MLLSSNEMMCEAKQRGEAVPSPDFWDSNSARAFVRVAEKMNKPLILSFAHEDIMSIEEAYYIGSFYAKKAKVPVSLHLDHGKTIDSVKRAIELGFTSVMIDASMESFDDNVRITRDVVRIAKDKGNIYTEAEIGHTGSEEEAGGHVISESIYTTPNEAKRFTELTGVDSLAVSIGTSHGAYKNGVPHIDFDVLRNIKSSVDIPLVLHGGSGTGDANLTRCAREGICKVNIYTDFITSAHEAVIKANNNNLVQDIDTADRAISEVLEHYYRILMFC